MGDRSELAGREQQLRLFDSGGMLHVETLPVAGTSLATIDLCCRGKKRRPRAAQVS